MQSAKKRKLADDPTLRVPSPSAATSTGKGPSNSPALSTAPSGSAIKTTTSSSFAPRAATSSIAKPPIPPPKYPPLPEMSMKRPKLNPPATPAYVPRAASGTAAAVGAAKPKTSLLAATLARAGGAGSGTSSAASSSVPPLTSKVAAILGTGGAGSGSRILSQAQGLTELARKPNKKGQVLRWKADDELVAVREFVQEAKELERMPWQVCSWRLPPSSPYRFRRLEDIPGPERDYKGAGSGGARYHRQWPGKGKKLITQSPTKMAMSAAYRRISSTLMRVN